VKKALVFCVLGLVSCGDDAGPLGTGDPGSGGATGGGSRPDPTPITTDPVPVGGCSDLFNEDVITDYQIHIDPAEWALIHDEFVNWQVRVAAGVDVNPYHPMQLQVGADVVPAWIRLKGNSTWFVAVAKNPNVKKQFVIAFDQGADSHARFHGVQKVELDQPTLDRSYLHERLAQSFLHDVGLPGLCANSARLIVNGAYYGLYANLEYVNKDYLARVFPGEDGGDLWKKSHERKTNENDPSHDDKRHRALLKATTIGELTALMDMEGSLRTWAAESLLPQPDGYWGADSNYYVYDHPRRGFIYLTDDLDATFDFMPVDMHPLYFWLNRDQPWRDPGPNYVVVMADDMWRGRFVEIISQLLAGWDVTALQERVDRWSAQIAPALEADPNKVATFAVHQAHQKKLRDFVAARPEAVRRWMACYHGGGVDADGDGYPWCMDCDDASPALHPGAAEICDDGIDQNCNGIIVGCN
jgi:hypothetical protein